MRDQDAKSHRYCCWFVDCGRHGSGWHRDVSGQPDPPHTLKNPLSITGSVVAGVTSVQSGQVLTFDFAIKNHRSASVDVDFDFTWTHATEVGITCPLVSSGADINPDNPFCEPGSQPAGVPLNLPSS